MYKVFLISINFATQTQKKSLPIFSALLARVRLNACEIIRAASLTSYKLKVLLSFLELSNMDQ